MNSMPFNTGGAWLPEAVKHGQNESGRLSSSGLGTGKDIAPFEYDGNGLGLNRSGFAVALFGHGTQQLGLEPEIGK